MHIQPKYLPYEPTTFFADGRSERQPVEGTVARGHLRLDELFYTGKENGVEADEFPFPITQALICSAARSATTFIARLAMTMSATRTALSFGEDSRFLLPITFSGCARRPPATFTA